MKRKTYDYRPVAIYLRSEDRERLKRLAHANGLNVSQYVRQLAFGETAPEYNTNACHKVAA